MPCSRSPTRLHDSERNSACGDPSGKARRRPALSCAECRRLKLKCDRQWPCHQCKKRGCASICPDGSLIPGKGNRFILANTEELHERVEALEEALAKATSSSHPLLRTSIYPYRTTVNASTASFSTVRSDSPGSPPRDDLLDTIGTLAIGDDGHCKYFGNGAGSEFFAPDELMPHDRSSHPSPSHVKASLLGEPMFPPRTREQLHACAPAKEEALALCNNFFQHAGWLYDVVNRDQFLNDTFMPIYYGTSTPSPHRLALLFMVLSLGSLFDLLRPLYQPDAERFYEMARACLSSEGCFGNTTIPALQALQLMTHYAANSPRKADAEVGWAQLGVLVKLAQSMGLHRDGAPWELPQAELELRRKVFWEIHMHEVYQALCFGRPYSMHRAHIDCALPNDPTARLNPDGTLGFGFHTIKYFICDKIMRIIDEAFCVTPPSYDKILQLDRDIREFQRTMVPEHLREDDDESRQQDEDVTTLLQRQVITCFLNEALLYLHRGCFTRAILENPADPTATRFSPSFVATHRSSCTVIRAVLDLANLQPALVKRLSVYWFHAFSAAVVLASICIRSPRSSLAPSAFDDLTAACDFFAAAEPASRAAQGLPLLRRLHAKALRAMCEAGFTPNPGLADDVLPSDDEHEIETPPVKKEADECALLGGRIRLDRTSPPRSHCGNGAVRINNHISHPFEWAPVAHQPMPDIQPFENAHPSLLEYLQRFNPAALMQQHMTQPSGLSQVDVQPDYTPMPDYVSRGGMALSPGYMDATFGPVDAQQAQAMMAYSQGIPVQGQAWQNYMGYMQEPTPNH